ncbi:MAG: family transporter [Streptosporangiaceae bacterium]|nr:family transporter [Streptosporangiaceae bacterium]
MCFSSVVTRFLDRLGRFCVRRRRAVFEVWFVLIMCVGYVGVSHGGVFVQQANLPGTETQKALDTLKQDFPGMTGPTATVVFHGTQGAHLDDWRIAVNIGKAIDNLSKLDRVAYVNNPYGKGGGGLKNRDAVMVQVFLKGTMGDVGQSDLDSFQKAVDPARQAGVDVKFGGIAAMIINQPKSGPGEAAGLVLALVVLLIAFGSFLAAGIPIVVSLCGMAVAYSLIHFGASQFELHPTAPLVAAMLGLGAGIDYALFIVTRYRQELSGTDDIEAAVGSAMSHAGHAVVFAGGTVVFAICGLFLSGITFIGRIGMGAALAVALMILAALTLLPAILGSLGTRIDRYKLPRRRRRSRRRARRGAAAEGPSERVSGWERWGRHVDGHAWPYAIGAIVILLFMSVPTLSLRFGVMADSTMPVANPARQAYDVVAKEFGPGRYSPFLVIAKVPAPAAKPAKKKKSKERDTTPVIKGPDGLSGLSVPGTVPTSPAKKGDKGGDAGKGTRSPAAKPQGAQTQGVKTPGPAMLGGRAPQKPNKQAERLAKDLRQQILRVPGVASVAQPVTNGNTTFLSVVPRTTPHDQATTALVHRLRGTEIPAVTKHYKGAVVYLGGENAAIIDLAEVVRSRMVTVMAAVVCVALLLLVIAFRSILVPLKAALMNLLSIGASYGVVVAVFQWGWGMSLLGLDQPAPIVSFVPLFMFALVFGLSMDYEVFLLSRIKEEYDRTNDPHGSVVTGIASTARLITSAALIMISVFASFLWQPDSMIQMMALGMTVAVAVDATIVRLVLVPALMSLLGHANWWFPGRRRRPAPEVAAGDAEAGRREREFEPA